MRPNLDIGTASATGATGAIERRQPQARADRWMMEFERAGVAGGKAAPHAPRSAAAPQAPAVTQGAAPAPAAAGRHAQAAYGAAPGGLHPVGATWSAPLAAGTSQAGMPAALAMRLAAQARGATPAAPQQPAVGTPASPVLPGCAAAAWTPLAGADEPAADADRLLQAAVSEPVPAGEEYARSLLHVVRGDDGVHAWLRDASLSTQQVRRVAAAMAGELAQAGTPLASLTVNGKKISASRSGVAAQEQDLVAPALRSLIQPAVKGA